MAKVDTLAFRLRTNFPNQKEDSPAAGGVADALVATPTAVRVGLDAPARAGIVPPVAGAAAAREAVVAAAVTRVVPVLELRLLW